MEKYEINKFLNEYETKLSALKQSLNILKKTERVGILENKTKEENFWQDPTAAQETINELNVLRDIVKSYSTLEKQLLEIQDMVEFALSDAEAMELFEGMVEELKKNASSVEEQSLFSDKYDLSNCILELHPGAGGTESMDWALMLYRMYTRFCALKGFKLQILDYLPGDEAGIKSVTMLITGPYAYGLFKGERGVHRLVRISPFDANARRHTSFVSCDVAPQIEGVSGIEIKDEDIKIDVYHSSGAGGQSVNTTDSAVRITHKESGIVVTCQNERSQIKNKEIALKILKSKLLDLEIKKQESELKELKGTQMNINFGSQIRSYVFCPYTLVKDHRTSYEVGNVNAVMDGDIEGFMLSYLRMLAGKNNE